MQLRECGQRPRWRSALIRVVLLLSLAGLSEPAPAAVECPDPLPKVDNAFLLVLDRDGKSETKIDANADKPGVELGDTLRLEGPGLDAITTCAKQGKPVVLFLEGHSLGDIRPEPSGKDALIFRLERGDIAPSKWAAILGKPRFGLVHLGVSVGIENETPLQTTARIALRVLPTGWFATWLIFFVALFALFIWLCGWSNILRGEGQVDDGTRPAYSLSRTQGAWWFFVIIAAYLLIGLVTGDFAASINATALILLGIGSATAVASAAVDAAKASSAKEQAARTEASLKTSTEVKETKAAVETAARSLVAAPEDPEKRKELAQKKEDHDRASELEAIVRNATRGFWVDILSDANGISFHRFQNVAWTLILSVVFARGVYQDLAMPTFDATLLGLMGVSAATFIGLKIPEPTIPTSKSK